MTINAITSSRPAVQTENTCGQTAPQIPVGPLDDKFIKQRKSAEEFCKKEVLFTGGYSHTIWVTRKYTNNRSEALKWASELVSGSIDGFGKIDFPKLERPSLMFAIESNYRQLSEMMHAIKYKPSDSKGQAEFNDGFSEFEKKATMAMEQGDVAEYGKALQRLSEYIALQSSNGGHFDVDDGTDLDFLLSDIDNAEVPRSVLQEAGPAFGTPAEVFHDPSAAPETVIPSELLGSAQFQWGRAPIGEGIYISPTGSSSEPDFHEFDEIISDIESEKKAQHAIREAEANPLERDVPPNLGRKNSHLPDGNGKKKNDGKSPRRHEGVAKSPLTAESEITSSGLPGGKALTREPAKTKDLQELLADRALREAKATKSRVRATRSSYKRVLAQRAERKFTTGSKTELIKHAASSLKTLLEDPHAWFYPDTQLDYLATMDNVFDCWINLTGKEEAKSSLTGMKKAFIERSLPLLAENKFSEFSSLFRRELMLMMDDFGYSGEFVRVLDRKRGVLASSHVTKKDFAKEIKVIADEMHGRVNLSGRYISNDLSKAVLMGGKSDILTMYKRIYDNSDGERRIQVGEFRKQFFEFSNMYLLTNDHAGFSSLCQKHAIAINKII
ncbi:hypothetical protein [Rhizobacter sp. OV335]|uniref:hypothetical protein n=1 Tax=Rhizobacter sp. OV335 TaxID=1500264 RepID=UPI0009116770|nr:hypothetical protein [Rhizobacter sp. OV335]SHN26586.1 hypothetical protein SAMN02787076_04583 [Rhizobacter sp. OV335]